VKELSAALSNLYDIAVKGLIETEHGSLNESYIVETDDKKYFLKRYLPEKQKGLDIQNTIHVYEVLESVQFRSFPHVIRNQEGGLSSEWGDGILVLTEFTKGEVHTRRDDLSLESLKVVGKTLGVLSNKTKGQRSNFPQVSSLDDSFWPPLIQYLSSNSIGEVKQKHFEFSQKLIEHIDEVKVQHQMYEEMKAKIDDQDLVLVHGEPAVDNIIFKTPTDPVLIDWDFSMFHVPEYNLKFYFFENFKTFWQGYSSEFALDVSKERLAFAIMHQQNNLLLMFINQILRNSEKVERPDTPFKYYRSIEEIGETVEKYHAQI